MPDAIGSDRLRVVIAPDSFKGSATAAQVAQAIAEGWRAERPDDELVLLPMADGGEGTISAFAVAFPRAETRTVRVDGPDDLTVPASWLLLPDRTAVVELANSSGITLLEHPRPLAAHTFGFGQAIRAALDAGSDRLLLAVGGSASTDGGAGTLSALGARLLDRHGTPIAQGNHGLAAVVRCDLGGLAALPARGASVLVDVTNPLLGPFGAARVFGPQKGATAGEIETLEANLQRFSEIAGGDPDWPGAGAAGGTAYGLRLWGAELESGSEAVGAALGVSRAIARSDLVITGEGRFDDQSAAGKVASYIARLCRSASIPALLVAGRIDAPYGREFVLAEELVRYADEQSTVNDPQQYLRFAGAAFARQVPLRSSQ